MLLYSTASVVPYRAYKTLDTNIAVGGCNDKLYGILCDKIGKPEWKTDARFVTNALRVKNRDTLDRIIEDQLKTKSTKEWLDVFEGSGMPYAAVNDIQGTLNHEHGMCIHACADLLLKERICGMFFLDSVFWKTCSNTKTSIVLARNMIEQVDHPACGPLKLINHPVKYSRVEPKIRSPPPLLGQHTDEVLRELLGFDEDKIGELRTGKTVA